MQMYQILVMIPEKRKLSNQTRILKMKVRKKAQKNASSGYAACEGNEEREWLELIFSIFSINCFHGVTGKHYFTTAKDSIM